MSRSRKKNGVVITCGHKLDVKRATTRRRRRLERAACQKNDDEIQHDDRYNPNYFATAWSSREDGDTPFFTAEQYYRK